MMYTEPPMEPPPAAEAAVSSFLESSFFEIEMLQKFNIFCILKTVYQLGAGKWRFCMSAISVKGLR